MPKFPHNFLPGQYDHDSKFSIQHNYLPQQFSDYTEIFKEIEPLIQNSAFTLGTIVENFEKNICNLLSVDHCISVGSGTDALFLSLIAANIGKGDEVITTPYTFYATIGAIATAGATPVFVDVRDDYNIDPGKIEKAITPNTKAILPVHWSGIPCDMDAIMGIARKHDLVMIEDASHAIQATYHDQKIGTFGLTGSFSMHPLKNLNVWGDGGFIVTNSDTIHNRLLLLRNHGLVDRDTCAEFAYNSRLDSIQAIVANHLLKKLDAITEKRIANANHYDSQLSNISEIVVPKRSLNSKSVFHIYVIRAQNRDNLKLHLNRHGIDAKIHYPIPMHLQPAAKKYGYQRGDFPNAEAICDSVISLPVHEFLTTEHLDFVVQKVKEFYASH